MQFSKLSSIIALAFAQQVLAQLVNFNVASGLGDGNCVPGTNFNFCSQANLDQHTCKANFGPGITCAHVNKLPAGCHLSLYKQSNNQGSVDQRITAGTVTGGPWLSIGAFCD